MSVKIGHASIDERGKARNGKAGDQTKAEVCTRAWYNGKFDYLLRPKTKELANGSAKACEDACANNNVGYDQNQRNTLYKEAVKCNFNLKKIDTPCESDCSSLMTVCAIAGGANLKYGTNGFTTSTMVKAFKASGDYEVFATSKYLSTDKYLKRGDILVREGYHTVMVLENGSEVKKPVTYFPKCASSARSIVDGLKSVGAEATKSYRKKIAFTNGIQNYSGKAEQNTKMLNLLKQGKLVKPN